MDGFEEDVFDEDDSGYYEHDDRMVIHMRCDGCGIKEWTGYIYKLTIATGDDDSEYNFHDPDCLITWLNADAEQAAKS